VLIITEKPDAAERIAKALDLQGKPVKRKEKGVPFFEAYRDRKLIVVSALGHLYTVVQQSGKRNYYPVFNFEWVPRHVAERKAEQIRDWIGVISNLAKDADGFIDSCDYDIEGSLIGYTILHYACEGKDSVAKRMKFSTLTKKELEEAYMNPMQSLDFPLIEAGKTRHEVDWLYGINLSRALTLSAKAWSGRYNTLSTGRVQGPTLSFLVEKEKEIKSFVPSPFWDVKARVQVADKLFEVDYEKSPLERKVEAAQVVAACNNREGKVSSVTSKRYLHKPPTPFDLGALQTEAYSLFRYAPRRTSDIAQRLYLDALISYPRTSSQKLPPAIDYTSILTSLSTYKPYTDFAEMLLQTEKLKPNEGEKDDPAHPAIYPTGTLPERPLSDSEQKIWDLIIRRFMATFGEPAVKEVMKVIFEVEGHRFILSGRRIVKEGWLRFYSPFLKSDDVILPPLKEGMPAYFSEVFSIDKYTNPPARFNPSSLLKRMEAEGIGTKATRADIIDTLYQRGYADGERIVVTDIGFDVVETLEKYCPSVISVAMTRELEDRMERIRTNDENRQNVLIDTVKRLKPILESFKTKEKMIGEALSQAIQKARLNQRVIGTCPSCGDGKLMILFSRRTRKRFIGCTNYFEGRCKTSFPLPQKGTVKPTGRNCSRCGWPLLIVSTLGRRPWNLCFNPNCPSKEKLAE